MLNRFIPALTLTLLLAGLAATPATAQTPPATPAAVPANPAGELTPPATPSRPSGDEAFQGLPWGASEAQVAERFAGRTAALPCEAATRAAAEKAGEWCGGLQVPRYVVAGIPFALQFHFDAPERRLVRVTLTHQPSEAALDDTRWSEQHRALRRLLSQRYGSPESTDVNNDSTAYTAYARWRRGTTVIELQSLLVRRASSRPAHEQVQVLYSSVLHGEAGKL